MSSCSGGPGCPRQRWDPAALPRPRGAFGPPRQRRRRRPPQQLGGVRARPARARAVRRSPRPRRSLRRPPRRHRRLPSCRRRPPSARRTRGTARAQHRRPDRAGLRVGGAPGRSRRARPVRACAGGRRRTEADGSAATGAGPKAPRLRPAGIDVTKISKDPAVVAAYQADPLVHHGKPTLGLGLGVVGQFAVLPERSRELRIPLLLQHRLPRRACRPCWHPPTGHHRRVGRQDRALVRRPLARDLQ